MSTLALTQAQMPVHAPPDLPSRPVGRGQAHVLKSLPEAYS